MHALLVRSGGGGGGGGRHERWCLLSGSCPALPARRWYQSFGTYPVLTHVHTPLPFLSSLPSTQKTLGNLLGYVLKGDDSGGMHGAACRLLPHAKAFGFAAGVPLPVGSCCSAC